MFQNLFLDHCWVCKTKFGSGLEKHYHHIVPRAFGGEDGPQITLCTAHHDILHKIANKIVSNKDYSRYLTEDASTNRRLLDLANVAARAELAFRDDPNKKTKVPLTLDGATHAKLKDLAKYNGLSQQKYIAKLLEAEHTRTFQVRRVRKSS